jgi:hypothetical protein
MLFMVHLSRALFHFNSPRVAFTLLSNYLFCSVLSELVIYRASDFFGALKSEVIVFAFVLLITTTSLRERLIAASRIFAAWNHWQTN